MPDVHRLGLGTYRLTGEQCVESIATALEAGYRHLDTAQMYGNEREVRRGIETSDVPRTEVFLATKLSRSNLAYAEALSTGRESADRLGVETIDLLYVHWPIDTYDPDGTCRALNELHDEGTVDRVGLSNFRPDQLDAARERLDPPVFAHQVECHPLFPQRELRAYARANDHWLVAYAPLARTRVSEEPVVRDIADAHDATPAQVSLAWLLSKERVAVIPKATSEVHIRENLAAGELDLTDEEIARIDAVDREERVVDFPSAPWNRPGAPGG